MEKTWKAALAELIGTFAFVFIGAGAICSESYTGGGVGLLGIALAHGLALAVVVSATGHLSGGHINPAVTAGFLVTRRIAPVRGLTYIGAQLLGATLAAIVLRVVFPPSAYLPVELGTPLVSLDITLGTGVLVEALLTFFLVFRQAQLGRLPSSRREIQEDEMVSARSCAARSG